MASNEFIQALINLLKSIFTLKGLKTVPKIIIIIALAALISIGILCDITKAQEDGKNYAISGVYLNNGKLYGLFGYAYRPNKSIGYFVQSEVGGDEQAFGGFPIVTFELSRRFIVGTLLGPQIEIVQQEPTLKDKLTYLGATTGIVGILQFTDRSAVWLAARYMFINENVKPFKIGVGLILDID